MLTQDVDSHHLQLLLSYMYRGQVIIIITIVIINMIVFLHLHSFCTYSISFYDFVIVCYLSQVDVEEHELGGFLKTATGLQIKGLSDDQGGQVGRIHQSSLIRHVENPKVEQIH